MAWEQQSPINLEATVSADGPRDYLRLAWSSALDGFSVVGDHGREIIFPLSDDKYLELQGKPFRLRSFHFHHPCEHLLNGKQFLGELHIVHQNVEDCSLAVIGIFLGIDPDARDNKELVALAECFQRAKESPCVIPLRPSWWLPDKRERVFRYEGSLTTPPFTESVSWIVLPEPKLVSKELFHAIFGSHPQKARGIQPLNRRYVLDLGIKILLQR
jgi:carbonic anhydrase